MELNADPAVDEPVEPRVPSRLVAFDADGLDEAYPDLDGLVADAETISLPDARTVSILRSRLVSVHLDVDESCPIDAVDSHLVGVDLRGRRITDLQRVRLERCRLDGADLGEARLRDVTFDDCALDLASLRAAALERVAIVGGRADGLDLSGARLDSVAVIGLPIVGLDLRGARSTRLDVRRADLAGIDDLAALRGAIVTTSQAITLTHRLAAAAGISIAEISVR